MKLLTLPSVDSTSSLRDAYDAMRRASKSGVIAQVNGEYRLYNASDVVVALAEGTAGTLEELTDWTVLRVPRRQDILKSVSVPAGMTAGGETLALDRGALEGALDNVGHAFGVLAHIGDQVLMMTRHENGGEPWEPAPSACYCMVDGKAIATPPGRNMGQCPDQLVHGKSVRCWKP